VPGLARIPAAALFALALGCSSADDGEELQRQLHGRVFVSEWVEGWELVPGSQVRMSFHGDRLGASAGCNSIDGDYRIDGSTLVLLGVAMTEMGCPTPGLHEQDDQLVDFLQGRPKMALAEPRLVLSTSSIRMSLLDREVASPDRPLTGTLWVAEAFGDGGGVIMGGPSMSAASVRFDPAGSVEIETGCQTGTGGFQVDGATIGFDSLVYDGAACADPALQGISDMVRSVLDGSPVTHAIEEKGLVLENGQKSLHLRASE
jgi:heat shock protein HslJ